MALKATNTPASIADPSLLPAEALVALLASDPLRGLDDAEAAQRLLADGPNQLARQRPPARWQRFLAQCRDPLIYLLLAAVAVTLLAWLIDGMHGVPIDAIVIVTIVLLNAAIGFLQEQRAERAADALARLSARHSTVIRSGRRERISSTALVRGDVLVLEEGDSVGADARLFAASALRAQEATLTGESETVARRAQQHGVQWHRHHPGNGHRDRHRNRHGD